MCPWSHLSSMSMAFKNYSSTTGMITLSCPRCLVGVTDSRCKMLSFCRKIDSLSTVLNEFEMHSALC